MQRKIRAGISTGLTLMSLAAGLAAQGADANAGRASAAACAECHQPRDWEGEGQASLESLIRDVARGNVKHSRKIELSETEIANIAAYWAASSR